TCLVSRCFSLIAHPHSTELSTLARGGKPFGLVADGIGFDWPAAQRRKNAVVDQLVMGVEGLLKAGGVTSFRGAARLAGGGKVALGDDTITAKDIVIATGSGIPPIPLQ